MVERHNRVVADYISEYCANKPSSWDQMIPYHNFVYNTTVYKTTEKGTRSRNWQLRIHKMAQRANQGGTCECQGDTGYKQEGQKDMYQKNVFGEKLKPGERVWLFAPHKTKSKKFFSPWGGPYNIIEETSEFKNKISKDANAKKWQIVQYNQIKPVKDDERPPRMQTRSSHYEKLQNQRNADSK